MNPVFSHSAHFSHSDDITSDAVAEFLLEGHAAREALVLIATSARRTAVASRLASRGFDFDSACDAGTATFLDAHAALREFMVDGVPDERRFRAAMQPVVDRCAAAHGDARVRAYGEMVDMLCQDGQHEAAIRLEELWNSLGRDQPLSLLCGYAMGNLHRETNSGIYDRICASHSAVHCEPPEAA